MADVKVCDKCSGFFNPRGAWQSLSAVTFTVDEDGIQRRTDSALELCGECAMSPNQTTAPVMRGALGTGPQLVDADHDIWEAPDGSFSVRRGKLTPIGPFSSLAAARKWVRGESGSEPLDADEEADL